MKGLLVEPINASLVSRYKLIAKRNQWQIIVLSRNRKNLEENDIQWNGSVDQGLLNKLKKQQFSAVIPGGEFSVFDADIIAKALNLTHNATIQINAYRDKHQMRKLFDEHHILQPNCYGRYSLSDNPVMMQFPVVFKPVNMASSLCIKLCYNQRDLDEAIASFAKQLQSYDDSLHFSDCFILEEYISGQEYSAECIIDANRCQYYQVTKKFTSKPPVFDELGHQAGIELAQKHQDALDAMINQVILAWHLNKTVIHIEFKIFNNQLYLIEVGNRIPGDRISDLIYLSSGISLEESLWLLRANQPVTLPRRVTAQSHIIQFLFSEDSHILIEDPTIDVVKVKQLRESNNKNLHGTHIQNRLAYVIYKHKQNKEKLS